MIKYFPANTEWNVSIFSSSCSPLPPWLMIFLSYSLVSACYANLPNDHRTHLRSSLVSSWPPDRILPSHRSVARLTNDQAAMGTNRFLIAALRTESSEQLQLLLELVHHWFIASIKYVWHLPVSCLMLGSFVFSPSTGTFTWPIIRSKLINCRFRKIYDQMPKK